MYAFISRQPYAMLFGKQTRSMASRRSKSARRYERRIGLVSGTALSHFEDYGENQRSLGGLLLEIASEIHADLFLDDAPVGFLFLIRLFHGAKNDFACAGKQL